MRNVWYWDQDNATGWCRRACRETKSVASCFGPQPLLHMTFTTTNLRANHVGHLTLAAAQRFKIKAHFYFNCTDVDRKQANLSLNKRLSARCHDKVSSSGEPNVSPPSPQDAVSLGGDPIWRSRISPAGPAGSCRPSSCCRQHIKRCHSGSTSAQAGKGNT